MTTRAGYVEESFFRVARGDSSGIEVVRKDDQNHAQLRFLQGPFEEPVIDFAIGCSPLSEGFSGWDRDPDDAQVNSYFHFETPTKVGFGDDFLVQNGQATSTPGGYFDGLLGSYDKVWHFRSSGSGDAGIAIESEDPPFLDLLHAGGSFLGERIFRLTSDNRMFKIREMSDLLAIDKTYCEFNRGVSQFRGAFGLGQRTLTDSDSPYTAGDDDTVLMCQNAGLLVISLDAPDSGNHNTYFISKGGANIAVTGPGGYSENLTATGAAIIAIWDGTTYQTWA